MSKLFVDFENDVTLTIGSDTLANKIVTNPNNTLADITEFVNRLYFEADESFDIDMLKEFIQNFLDRCIDDEEKQTVLTSLHANKLVEKIKSDIQQEPTEED